MSQVNERIYKARSGEYKIIYIAPERLESEAFLSALRALTISFLAIDEAHCVSAMGSMIFALAIELSVYLFVPRPAVQSSVHLPPQPLPM